MTKACSATVSGVCTDIDVLSTTLSNARVNATTKDELLTRYKGVSNTKCNCIEGLGVGVI